MRKVLLDVVSGLEYLHSLRIIHRDIKPDNVILTEDGGLRLVDLGVARLPRIEDFPGDAIPGTPSFMAPELFDGNAGDEATDQFALGVTFCRLFAGMFPYGEIEAFSRPRFGKPKPPSAARENIPAWLDDIIMRTIAVNPDDRFGDVIELLRALEGGPAIAAAQNRQFRPLIERNPLLFWKLLCLLLALLLAVSVATRG